MSKNSDGPKRQFTLTIDEDMFPGVLTYMQTHGIERVPSAVRSLLMEALAATPRDGLVVAAGRRAYNSVMSVLLEATGRFYAEMKGMTDSTISDLNTMRMQCPHCGIPL